MLVILVIYIAIAMSFQNEMISICSSSKYTSEYYFLFNVDHDYYPEPYSQVC